MTLAWEENFDTGPSGDAITTSNSTVDYASSGRFTFTNTASIKGGLACRADTRDGAGPALGYNAGSLIQVTYWRAYVYFEVLPVQPRTTITSVLGMRAGPSTFLGDVAIDANDSYRLSTRNGLTKNAWSSTYQVQAGEWFRVEWMLDAGVAGVGAKQRCRLFYGANLHGTSPDEDSGDQTYDKGTFDRHDLGHVLGSYGGVVVYDEVAVDPAGWIGPVDLGYKSISGSQTATATQTATMAVPHESAAITSPLVINGASTSQVFTVPAGVDASYVGMIAFGTSDSTPPNVTSVSCSGAGSASAVLQQTAGNMCVVVITATGCVAGDTITATCAVGKTIASKQVWDNRISGYGTLASAVRGSSSASTTSGSTAPVAGAMMRLVALERTIADTAGVVSITTTGGEGVDLVDFEDTTSLPTVSIAFAEWTATQSAAETATITYDTASGNGLAAIGRMLPGGPRTTDGSQAATVTQTSTGSWTLAAGGGSGAASTTTVTQTATMSVTPTGPVGVVTRPISCGVYWPASDPDDPLVPAQGWLVWTPTRRRVVVTGNGTRVLVLPVPIPVPITDPPTVVDLEIPDGTWSWQVREDIEGQAATTRLVSFTSGARIAYADLVLP